MNIAAKILTPCMPKLQSRHGRKPDQMNITLSGSLSLHPVIFPQLSSRAFMGEIYWQVHFCTDCLSSNVVLYNKYLPLLKLGCHICVTELIQEPQNCQFHFFIFVLG